MCCLVFLMLLSKQFLFFIAGVSVFLFFSCQKQVVRQMTYDSQRECFVNKKGKRGVPLRLKNGHIVDSANVEEFKLSYPDGVAYSPFVYKEPFEIISNENANLAFRYEMINKAIIDSLFVEAIAKIDELLFYAPELTLHSDVLYLKAYCLQSIGKKELARVELENYIAFSERKFSRLFSGYLYYDESYDIHRLQKSNARSCLASHDLLAPVLDTFFLAKYYYQNHLPGYTYNDDALAQKRMFAPFFGLYARDTSRGVLAGGSFHLSDVLSLNVSGIVSDHYEKIKVGMPVQLFKTPRNEFGISSRLGAECVFLHGLGNVDFGFTSSIGAGYFVNQKNSLHVAYFFRSDLYFTKIMHEYEMSICRHVLRNLSLKVGFGSLGATIGVYLDGADLGFSFTQKSLVIKHVL